MHADDRDQRAERLAPIAVELAARIRDEHPDQLHHDLTAHLTRQDLIDLVFLLAGAADTGVPARVWWDWVRHQAALAHAEPIRWADDERPIEELTTPEINDLIVSLAGKGRKNWEIADRVHLAPHVVQKRLERIRKAEQAKVTA